MAAAAVAAAAASCSVRSAAARSRCWASVLGRARAASSSSSSSGSWGLPWAARGLLRGWTGLPPRRFLSSRNRPEGKVLETVGVFEVPKQQGKYDTGQVSRFWEGPLF
ncbi:polymerase delta-interacting protein 2-like [Sceloporus undulatus]|uniref:polymerase delta-interacting protein 2-like n=1 Tax=Sceloporus undulatus TaxID=8520 RepID=UPI001C4ABDAC|nr:polymerase delta-interacting protein 2-like [Sceloporus undulatus]